MERRSKERAPAISLGVRAALFTSLSVLTALLLSALVLEVAGRSQARGAANEQLHRARNLAAGRLAGDGDNLRRLAATVARDPKFFALLALRRSERTASFRQSLEGVIREFQADANVEIFDVTDEWGATAAASQRPAAPEPSRGASPLVRQALAGKSALGFRLEGGRLYRIAVVPVMGGGAAAVGTLTLGSRVDESFAGVIRATTGAEVLLLAGEIPANGGARPTARPIMTTLSDAAARSVLETIGGPPRASESRGRVPRGRQVSLAKAPALALDVPLDGATEGGAARLLLIAPIALDAALVPLRETLLFAGAVAATFALVLGYVVGRRMAKRLGRIRTAARAAGQGDYDAPLPVVLPDEVGLLTADFAAMRETQHREFDRLHEIDRMKTDFLAITAQDLRTPVDAIRRASDAMAARNAGALGTEGVQRLRVIRGGADTLGRMVHDLESARVVLTQMAEAPAAGPDAENDEEPVEASIEVVAGEANFQPAVARPAPAAPAAEPAPTVEPAPSATSEPEAAGSHAGESALLHFANEPPPAASAVETSEVPATPRR
ncbi:MAG TPA: HAMP domain-containing protein, partial [Candidatus Eisenbacteria bacterium]|nr:HAMP domain-containing protein [Candidatus Eisenbacteria bacterium]